MKTRQILWVLMGLVLVAIAVGAGYGLYPLLHDAPGVVVAERHAGATAEEAGAGDLGVFWEAWRLLDANFYGAKPSDEDRARGAVRGMVDAFGDPYTVYVEPQPRELERDRLRGSFGGIGATIEFTGTRFLLRPIESQPAQQAGVLDGDELRRVDAITVTANMSTDEVVSLVRGPIGSTVNLGIRRGANAQEVSIDVVRAEIHTPSIEYRLLDASALPAGSVPDVTPAPGTDGAQGVSHVGYLRHTVFSERSASEMRAAIAALVEQGADRFIWDLRGNPGGLVDAAVATADIWLDSGAILIEEHADGSNKVFSATAGGEGVRFPLILLVDAGSASASEIVAGALQDQGRARLVGERTYGKGSVQLIYELADESSLHVTNAQWFTPLHRPIQGSGLAPDVAVEAGQDPLPVAIEAARTQPVQRTASR